jgi:rod shape-determining protein MreC
MNRILQFLQANRNLFYFLLLEILALQLLSRFNDPHRELAHQTTALLTGWVDEGRHNLQSYFNLADKNAELQAEALALRAEITHLRDLVHEYQSLDVDSTKLVILSDSIRFTPEGNFKFQFLPCRVVNNTVMGAFNYFVIDKGSRAGVKVDMGVMAPNGVAGIVVGISENYAVAMSLLNKRMKLTAKIKDREIFGTLEWDGNNPRYANLSYIPLHYNLSVGDTIITSGFSSIFPEGFPIGQIHEIDNETNESFYDLRVQLFTDFYRLDYLYLVKSAPRPQIDSLIQLVPQN